jgi:hypothetical protein
LTYGQTALPNNVHYRHHVTNVGPGAIGQHQLTRGGPIAGYFQPVQIQAPSGAKISLAIGGQFGEPQAAPVTAGMLIGQVYRLRVTEIPIQEGLEVFPTVEVINRLYPPEGKKWRFPIPVQLTQEELGFALAGKYVTRVIYLEDPERPLPLSEQPGFQRWFEVTPQQDPLQAADRLGRPMVILRMGSRTPNLDGPDLPFLFGCPPLVPAPPLGLLTPQEGPADNGVLEQVAPPRSDDAPLPDPQARLPDPRNARLPWEARGR